MLRRRARLYTAAAKVAQMSPFMTQYKSVSTGITQMYIVNWGMFRSSYSNCAGGKPGNTKVIAASIRKAPANIATADMFIGLDIIFFYVYEFEVFIEN